MNTYTVFVCDADQVRTVFITSVEAESIPAARRIALTECADAWGMHSTDELHVLGVADGDVQILEWTDVAE